MDVCVEMQILQRINSLEIPVFTLIKYSPYSSITNNSSLSIAGCGGNGNNYESEEMCRERCVPVTVECPRGLPLRSTQGYYVNCAKQSCPSTYQCHTIGAQAICCEEEKKSEGTVLILLIEDTVDRHIKVIIYFSR